MGILPRRAHRSSRPSLPYRSSDQIFDKWRPSGEHLFELITSARHLRSCPVRRSFLLLIGRFRPTPFFGATRWSSARVRSHYASHGHHGGACIAMAVLVSGRTLSQSRVTRGAWWSLPAHRLYLQLGRVPSHKCACLRRGLRSCCDVSGARAPTGFWSSTSCNTAPPVLAFATVLVADASFSRPP